MLPIETPQGRKMGWLGLRSFQGQATLVLRPVQSRANWGKLVIYSISPSWTQTAGMLKNKAFQTLGKVGIRKGRNVGKEERNEIYQFKTTW